MRAIVLVAVVGLTGCSGIVGSEPVVREPVLRPSVFSAALTGGYAAQIYGQAQFGTATGTDGIQRWVLRLADSTGASGGAVYFFKVGSSAPAVGTSALFDHAGDSVESPTALNGRVEPASAPVLLSRGGIVSYTQAPDGMLEGSFDFLTTSFPGVPDSVSGFVRVIGTFRAASGNVAITW